MLRMFISMVDSSPSYRHSQPASMECQAVGSCEHWHRRNHCNCRLSENSDSSTYWLKILCGQSICLEAHMHAAILCPCSNQRLIFCIALRTYSCKSNWSNKDVSSIKSKVIIWAPFPQWLVAWREWPNSMDSYPRTALPKCVGWAPEGPFNSQTKIF